MKRTLLVLAFALFPAVAMAQSGTGIGIGQSQSGAAALSGSQNSLTINNPASITTNATNRQTGTLRQINVPSVFAPGLAAAGIETCLGSVSGGVAFPGGGVSFGSTTKDTGCDTRLDARTLWAFGLKPQAVARLCMKEETRAALGAMCPSAQPQTVAYAGTASASPTDGGIWLREGRTGKDRYCLTYDAPAQRCRKWK